MPRSFSMDLTSIFPEGSICHVSKPQKTNQFQLLQVLTLPHLNHPAHCPHSLPALAVCTLRGEKGRMVPHVRLHIQQLQGSDPRPAGQVLQDLQPGPAVLVVNSVQMFLGQRFLSRLEPLPERSADPVPPGKALPFLLVKLWFWGNYKIIIKNYGNKNY